MSNSIFQPALIGGIKARNPIVRSATMEGRFDGNHRIADNFISLYRDLASSGVGIIVTGMLEVTPLDHGLDAMMHLYKKEGQDDLKKLVDVVHGEGGKIVVQISAVGSQIPKKYIHEGVRIVSPSGVQESLLKTQSCELTKEEIAQIINDFAKSVKAVKDSGADGAQIQCSHGYLLSHFLSPYYNKRSDEYGGSLENRVRIILEIITKARELVGTVYPIWVKINCQDFMDSGNFTFEEAKKVMPMLERVGVNAIEISGGSVSARFGEGVIRMVTRRQAPTYFLEYAKELAKLANVSVGVVGGFRSIHDIEQTLNETDLEFVAMSRPFIRENKLMSRWLNGDTADAHCISCNRCLQYSDKGVYCIFDPGRPIKNTGKVINRRVASK